MTAKAKKVFSIISKILTVLIVAFTVLVMAFTIISVTTVDRADRSIFGYRAYIVMSDSMSDTFQAGDIIFSKIVEHDDGNLQPGTIITFYSEDYGQTVTHMIREQTTYNGVPAYITYGTTTGSDDQTPVYASFVTGIYSFRLPKLGYFFNFLKTPAGYVCVILLPFLIVIAIIAVHFVRLVRAYKKEKDKEALATQEAVLAAAEADRQEAARLREEMEELKARMAALTGEDTAVNGGVSNAPAAELPQGARVSEADLHPSEKATAESGAPVQPVNKDDKK